MQGSGMGGGGGGAPRARRQARLRAVAGGATHAEDPHAVAEFEGEPFWQRARDALAVEAAEGAR
eukprot:1252278-Prymnesium_polylepis.1